MSGCVDPSGDEEIIPSQLPHAGVAHYQVRGDDISISAAFHGLVDVLDRSHRVVEALEVRYVVLDGSHRAVYYEYVNESTGAVVFQLESFCIGGTCDRGDFFFMTEGLGGFFGLAPVVIGREADREASRTGDNCALASPSAGAVAPIPPSIGKNLFPYTARDPVAEFCPGTPVPQSIAAKDWALDLTSFEETQAARRIYDTARTLPPPTIVPWDGVSPPEGPVDEEFPFAEGWAYARENDSGFRAFLQDHEDALLHGTWAWLDSKAEGGAVSGGETWWERGIAIQSPVAGEVYEVVLKKHIQQISGLPEVGTITIAESGLVGKRVSLDPALLPERMVQRESAWRMAEALMGRPVLFATVASTVPTLERDERASNIDHFSYRFFTETGDGNGGLMFPYEVRLSSNTGELQHLFAPPAVWFGSDPPSMDP